MTIKYIVDANTKRVSFDEGYFYRTEDGDWYDGDYTSITMSLQEQLESAYQSYLASREGV